jgi:hypothetical protein
MLLRLDFQDFFPAFPAARVQALFRTFGYPETVADRLGGIATNAVPWDFWSRRPAEVDLALWGESRILYSQSTSAARCADVAGACQSNDVSAGLPAVGVGAVGWRGVYAVCG